MSLNGKKVTEKVYGEVVFTDGVGWFVKHIAPDTKEIVYSKLNKLLDNPQKEVIGKIYENPELLEKIQ